MKTQTQTAMDSAMAKFRRTPSATNFVKVQNAMVAYQTEKQDIAERAERDTRNARRDAGMKTF